MKRITILLIISISIIACGTSEVQNSISSDELEKLVKEYGVEEFIEITPPPENPDFNIDSEEEIEALLRTLKNQKEIAEQKNKLKEQLIPKLDKAKSAEEFYSILNNSEYAKKYGTKEFSAIFNK